MTTPDGEKRRSAAARVAAELKKTLARGGYPPDTYFPSERELAREFQTSRTTISTALAMLRDEGLVVQTPGRGTRALPPLERRGKDLIGVYHGKFRPTVWPEATEVVGMLQGTHDAFARLGCRYQVVPLDHEERRARSVDDLMAPFGAILFMETMGIEEKVLEIHRRGGLVVVANMEVDVDVSATWVDHRKTTARAVEMLVSFGHRRIAFLGRDPHMFFYGRALEGYLEGLAKADLPRDDALTSVAAGVDSLNGFFAAKPLLELPDPPTAIVCGRDSLAQGACGAIEEAGLTVGSDVSVIGFDDFSWPQDEPFLTTFREPCYELGAVAAEMLCARIVNGAGPAEKREISAPLVLRRSAGPRMLPAESRRRVALPVK